MDKFWIIMSSNWEPSLTLKDIQNSPSCSKLRPISSFSSGGMNCHSGLLSLQGPTHSASLPQGFRMRTRGILPETLGVSISQNLIRVMEYAWPRIKPLSQRASTSLGSGCKENGRRYQWKIWTYDPDNSFHICTHCSVNSEIPVLRYKELSDQCKFSTN